MAFLRWWIGVSECPEIPGMKYNAPAKTRYALAVMDRANPQHGLALGAKGWPKHVAAMPHAAAIVLQGLLAS